MDEPGANTILRGDEYKNKINKTTRDSQQLEIYISIKTHTAVRIVSYMIKYYKKVHISIQSNIQPYHKIRKV